MLFTPCINNDYFVIIHKRIIFLNTQLYYIKALKTPTRCEPCGVIKKYVHQANLYKTLNN
jgi:hypothetical protein